jgi:EmrB/QacA subfamily drug resistance transporter
MDTDRPVPRALGLAAVCLGTFMLLLDLTVINVALPSIQVDLGASFEDLQWLIDAYAVTLAAFLLAAGALGDRIGRRRVFVAGLLLFVAASVACALATTPQALIWSRGAQGVGGAIMLAVAPALIAQEYVGRERDKAFAAFGGAAGLAIASGPLVGGGLTAIDWTWIFWLNVPLGVLCFALSARGLRDVRFAVGTGRLGAVSALVLCPALFLVVFGLTEATSAGWTAGVVTGSIAVGLVLLAVVTALQRVPALRIFDAGLLGRRTFLGLSLATLLVFAAIFPIMLFTVLFLQRLLGYSPLQTGLRVLPLTLVLFLTSAATGIVLAPRVPRRLLVAGSLLVTGVGLLLLRLVDVGSSWTALLPGLVVAGLGVGVFNPVRAEATVSLVDERDSGMASGLGSTFQEVGVAFGVALFGTVFSTSFTGRLVERGLPTDLDPVAAADRLAAARAAGTPQARQLVDAVDAAFIDAWHQLSLLTGLTCVGAAVLAFLLMRDGDFPASPATGAPATAAAVPEPGAAAAREAG